MNKIGYRYLISSSAPSTHYKYQCPGDYNLKCSVDIRSPDGLLRSDMNFMTTYLLKSKKTFAFTLLKLSRDSKNGLRDFLWSKGELQGDCEKHVFEAGPSI